MKLFKTVDEKLAEIGNACVGLTGYEMQLFLKKMKRMKMYSGKKVSIE